MKRSNRLILLVGIFLAVVAFVGVALLLSSPASQNPETTDTLKAKVVVATADIPLGATIEQDQVQVIEVDQTNVPAGALGDPILAVGKVARERVSTGEPITTAVIAAGTGITNIEVPTGRRAIAVQVDQVTGVGTVIKPGDFVDMVVGFTADKFPVVVPPDEDEDQFTVLTGVNGTSVKLLLQGMQVLGTLLPPTPTAEGGEGAQPGDQPTTLTGQQEIVILSVLPQQAEVIKFAQMDGNISLVLRNAQEFFDPATGDPIEPVPDATTGIILRILVDQYGVLVPELVEAVLPQAADTP